MFRLQQFRLNSNEVSIRNYLVNILYNMYLPAQFSLAITWEMFDTLYPACSGVVKSRIVGPATMRWALLAKLKCSTTVHMFY